MDLVSCPFDSCRFYTIVFDALAAGCFAGFFTVSLGVVAGIAIDRLYRRPRFEQQEKILSDLAKLRLAGVRLRNRGSGKTMEDDDFEVWNDQIEDWKDKLYKKADEFSPVEGERLRTVDDMPAQVFAVQNPKQVHVLRYVSETLRRLDRLLEQKFRPTLAP